MKATLEFNLDDYHDKLAHKRAISADSAYLALHRICEEIFRPQLKYADLSDNQYEILDKTYEKVRDVLEDLNLNLNDLE